MKDFKDYDSQLQLLSEYRDDGYYDETAYSHIYHSNFKTLLNNVPNQISMLKDSVLQYISKFEEYRDGTNENTSKLNDFKVEYFDIYKKHYPTISKSNLPESFTQLLKPETEGHFVHFFGLQLEKFFSNEFLSEEKIIFNECGKLHNDIIGYDDSNVIVSIDQAIHDSIASLNDFATLVGINSTLRPKNNRTITGLETIIRSKIENKKKELDCFEQAYSKFTNIHDSIKKECNDVHKYITENITGAPDTIGKLFVEERMVKNIFPDGEDTRTYKTISDNALKTGHTGLYRNFEKILVALNNSTLSGCNYNNIYGFIINLFKTLDWYTSTAGWQSGQVDKDLMNSRQTNAQFNIDILNKLIFCYNFLISIQSNFSFYLQKDFKDFTLEDLKDKSKIIKTTKTSEEVIYNKIISKIYIFEWNSSTGYRKLREPIQFNHDDLPINERLDTFNYFQTKGESEVSMIAIPEIYRDFNNIYTNIYKKIIELNSELCNFNRDTITTEEQYVDIRDKILTKFTEIGGHIDEFSVKISDPELIKYKYNVVDQLNLVVNYYRTNFFDPHVVDIQEKLKDKFSGFTVSNLHEYYSKFLMYYVYNYLYKEKGVVNVQLITKLPPLTFDDYQKINQLKFTQISSFSGPSYNLNVKLFDTAETYPPTPNHHRSLLSMIAFKFKTITRSNSGPELITRAKAIRPTYSRGNKNNEERFLNFDIKSTIEPAGASNDIKNMNTNDLDEHRKVYKHLQKHRNIVSYSQLCYLFKNVILTNDHNSEILSDKTFVKEFIKFIILYDFYIKQSRSAQKPSSAEVNNLLSQIDRDPDCNNITQTTSTQKEEQNQGSPKKMTCGKVGWNSTQKTDGKLFLSGNEFPWEKSQGSKTGRSRPTTARDTPAAGLPTPRDRWAAPRGMGGGKKTKRLHKKKRGKRTRHCKKNQTRPLRKKKVKPTKKK